MVRLADVNDFAAVMRLLRQLKPAEPVLVDGSDVAAFATIVSSPWFHFFVAERNGLVVATTYLNVIPNLTNSVAPYAVIENVVVDEGLRESGIGKEIMAATLEYAWTAGCYKVVLTTGSTKPSTHGFYRSCGFSPDTKTAYMARRP